MKLQLVAVGTKMPAWVETGFQEYVRRFPKDMPFELLEIPAGKRGKNADIKRILEKEGTNTGGHPKRQPDCNAGYSGQTVDDRAIGRTAGALEARWSRRQLFDWRAGRSGAVV